MSPQDAVSRRLALAQFGAAGLTLGLLNRSSSSVSAQEGSPGAMAGELPPIIAAYEAAWNAHDDGSELVSLVTDDVVWEDVPNGFVFEGQDAVAGYLQENYAAFPDLTALYTSGMISGTMGATEWVYNGNYTGQFPNLPAGTGQPVSFRGVDVLEFKGDKISYIRTYYDLFTLLVQIGVIPAPEEAATPAP